MRTPRPELRGKLLALVVLLLLAGPVASASAYPWPFKPFDKQHPIRGSFGDPRTIYLKGILANPFDGPGTFGFHQGVDIAAPNGTPIYSVSDGVAHYLGAATLNVRSAHHVTFQYFHIVPVVGEGEKVVRSVTVLGYVQAPFGHVHLTEIDGIHIVNPLEVGHLSPYKDHTVPTIGPLVITSTATGATMSPLGVCGSVQLAVTAYDTPPLPVPGTFNGLPLTPAFVAWTLRNHTGGTVRPWTAVADFRRTLPPRKRFWTVYAHGTYENGPRFGKQQYTSMPGYYLFLLAAHIDTSKLPNGVYYVTVRARDERGNEARVGSRFSVLHDGGTCPGTASGGTTTTPPEEPTP